MPPLGVRISTVLVQKGDRTQEAIGRSKGGLTTKLHATCNALGHPTGCPLTLGQASNSAGTDVLLPAITGDIVMADKAFEAEARVREPLKQAGKTAVLPPKANRKVQRPYDEELYKARHLSEKFFARLKQYRTIATRYDKRAKIFLAAVYLAAAIIWLN